MTDRYLQLFYAQYLEEQDEKELGLSKHAILAFSRPHPTYHTHS